MNKSQEYTLSELRETDIDSNPFNQFAKWYEEAKNSSIHEPEAMTLATVSAEGKPSTRLVLLRGHGSSGFSFYTNYLSRKGRDLELNPWVSLIFWWDRLERQVRIDGKATKMTDSESDVYFHNRPRGHQISAWASPQSRVITNRSELEEEANAIALEYEDSPIPRPSNWGGYTVWPTSIEFWQGRPDRLHDRLVYQRQTDNSWKIMRLAP